MSTNVNLTNGESGDQPPRRDPIIVELGAYTSKQIRKLRKGRGKLYDAMNEVTSELERTGSISGTVQPVVLVVRERDQRDNVAYPGCW
jgi:hypothetical protein